MIGHMVFPGLLLLGYDTIPGLPIRCDKGKADMITAAGSPWTSSLRDTIQFQDLGIQYNPGRLIRYDTAKAE